MRWPKAVEDYFQTKYDSGEYEYMDNYRAAPESDANLVGEYEDRKDAGCCGSCDEKIDVDGETWIVGFNYGH